MIRLINDNCLNAFPDIPDKSVDFILCDMPYGCTHNKDDIRLPLDKVWEQYKRIIKNSGCIALFCQGVFFVDLVNSNREWFRYDLVWDKVLTSGFLNANKMPLRKHEQIAIFYKNLPTYNPQYTEGKPLHSKGTKYLSKDITNNNYGFFKNVEDTTKGETKKYPTSIITIQKPHPSKSEHRTEKPIELLKWLIKTFSNEGETVLDNCMGAGNTGIASILTGRNFIGIEKDKEIFKLAETRIKEYYGRTEKDRSTK